jgi:hypothetical protein
MLRAYLAGKCKYNAAIIFLPENHVRMRKRAIHRTLTLPATALCPPDLCRKKLLALPAVFALCLCLLSSMGSLQAQNLENFGSTIRSEGLNITGNINLSNQTYWSSGIAPRRDGMMSMINAGLNLRFLGISAPFNFSFSDQNARFNLPSYSFIGISPRYKWATLHAGDRNMNFSKYTMNGISFRGAGFELNPGKFQTAFFYGKLNRALAHDLTAAGSLNNFYQRNGLGARIAFNDQNASYALNFFSASDADDNFPLTELGERLLATDNMVLSLQARQRITKRLSLNTELAHSVYNQNRSAPPIAEQSRTLANRMFGLFNPTQSLLSGQAYNIGLQYNVNQTGIQAAYERIDRGFRTLGALFFNNDTENITLGLNRSFLKNKLQAFVNGGLERVNLDSKEMEATDRIIASLNLNYRPDDNWFFSGMYGNFRNDTKLRVQTDVTIPVDSIFLAQVNQSGNIMALRRFGTEARPSNLQFMLNHQRAQSVVNDSVVNTADSRFTTAMLNFSSGSPASGLQWNAGLTLNFIELGALRNQSFAPVLGLNKTLWNNALTLNFNSALSFFQQAGSEDSKVLNLNLGGRYQLRNSHRVGLSAIHINRFGSADAIRNFHEWYGQLNYGYSFGGKIGGER